MSAPHTWTGSGSVPYWNAYVAATQMHGTEVTFYDPRLSDPAQYPVAARSGSWNTRGIDPGNASDKLDALHYYQLSIPRRNRRRFVRWCRGRRGNTLFLSAEAPNTSSYSRPSTTRTRHTRAPFDLRATLIQR